MRQDVFVVAYQEAKLEMLEITARFEQLRQRKERLEKVVAVLGPMFGVAAAAQAELKAGPVSANAQSPAEPVYTFNQVAAQEQEDDGSADPFQKRVRNALKFGGSRREGLLNAM
jgi:hypothetical protein